MISYELAKELKDAGFPFIQKKMLTRRYDKVHAPPKGEMLSAEYELVPPLEELIGACGDDFQMLVQRNEGQCWGAVAGRKSPRGYFDERGSTPTEAIARLYLALNKKI